MDICINGSSRFKDKIDEVSQKLKLLGISHSLPITDISKEEEYAQRLTPKLVHMHFKKIDVCKILYVVNLNGYIGNSVKIEIGYAKAKNKKIIFLEKTNLAEVDCLADNIINESELEKLKQLLAS